MMVGRFVGSAILAKFEARKLLTACLILGACCVGIYFADVIINFMMVLAYMVLRVDNQPEVVVESTDYTEVQ